jgi:RNA polymerase sigma factor (sigma-70 family)
MNLTGVPSLDIAMTALHLRWMPGRDDAIDPNRALARNAEPLRDALARYFARRVRNTAEVDDLVQDVFARIVARDSRQPVAHLSRYVFQTAASVLADWGRRRVVRRASAHVAFDPDRHGDSDLDADRILIGKENLRAATAALLSLPPRTRSIFVLHRLEGLRYADIAQQLGISLSAVEKHMYRAAKHLSAIIGDRP